MANRATPLTFANEGLPSLSHRLTPTKLPHYWIHRRSLAFCQSPLPCHPRNPQTHVLVVSAPATTNRRLGNLLPIHGNQTSSRTASLGEGLSGETRCKGWVVHGPWLLFGLSKTRAIAPARQHPIGCLSPVFSCEKTHRDSQAGSRLFFSQPPATLHQCPQGRLGISRQQRQARSARAANKKLPLPPQVKVLFLTHFPLISFFLACSRLSEIKYMIIREQSLLYGSLSI